jgi:hypothetical protein
MANKDLFAQAIADAKKLKEISLENAKQAIEEAFAPRIQEMFRLKLSELDEPLQEDEAGDNEELKAAAERDHEQNRIIEKDEEPVHEVDETTLEEILAELELEEGEDEDKMMHEAKDEEEEASEEDAEKAEDEEVTDLSIDEFKDLIRDVVADVLASQSGAPAEEEAGGDAAPEGDLEGGDEEAISLDEILSEMEEKHPDMKKEEAGNPINEDFMSFLNLVADVFDVGIKQAETIVNAAGGVAALAAVVPALMSAAKKEKAAGGDPAAGIEKSMTGNMEEATKEELHEAIETINTLKAQLNEVNLLNAKLLYVNKIFKAKSLTEAQKVKVVSAFDRATTLKEAKNIYETLKDSLTTTATKAPIKESLGFASKPIGNAPAKPIVEADSYVYRMQQLAGIRQPNI